MKFLRENLEIGDISFGNGKKIANDTTATNPNIDSLVVKECTSQSVSVSETVISSYSQSIIIHVNCVKLYYWQILLTSHAS
jgi:hypothetical protein